MAELIMTEEGSTPATPGSNKWKVYFKAGGLYIIDDAGSETGPLLSLASVYPVGSIYISVVSTNPATLFGFGTWTAFATGKTLVGIDAGQTEFDTVEETGGEKTHTLIDSEIPAHSHSVTGSILRYVGTGGVAQWYSGGTDADYTTSTDENVGDGAHNNLQPYVVVYMWKRTA